MRHERELGRHTSRWAALVALMALSCGGPVPRAPSPAAGTTASAASPPAAPRPVAASATPHPTAAEAATVPAPPAWPSLPITRTTTAEGLAIVVARRAGGLPLLHVRWVIEGGALADRPGVAALTAALVAAGAGSGLDGAAVSQRLGAVGASLEIHTRPGTTELGLTVPRAQLADALALLGALGAAERLDAGVFHRMRQRAMREAADVTRQSGWAAIEVLERSLRGHGSVQASRQELGRNLANHCDAYYRQHYRPDRSEVWVVGDVEPASVAAAAAEAFAPLRARADATPTPPAPRAPAVPGGELTIHLLDSADDDVAQVVVAALLPAATASSLPALQLLTRLLAEDGGRRLRTDPTVPAVEVHLTPRAGGPSWLRLRTEVAAERAADALRDLRAALTTLDRERFPPAAVAVGRQRQLSEWSEAYTSVAGVADRQSTLHMLGLRLDDDVLYPQYLGQVSDAVLEQLVQTLAPSAAAVVVGDRTVLAPLLQPLGEVALVDPYLGLDARKRLPRLP